MHYSNPQAHAAKIVQSTDGDKDGYKNGWIKCQACGWSHDLGDGFLQTVIETCAKCDPTVSTHTQRKVIVSSKTGRGFDVHLGRFEYMHTQSICVWYEWHETRRVHVATEAQADHIKA